ncbi:hypothetical protein XA3_20650 [Xylocopilactobacillus apicola]|uniref:Fido domain-containing protein n=1 Tax=Xylocopilactobacillus apicola TaxID=2932184 RepID=A0AAU9D041_9LACO|nr:hypothetical protein XA3_20650 [Xylocopilactobacillus apicola]
MQLQLHPVQYVAELHQRFVTIHPFIDGNGRTARLLLNFALTQAGYPVISVSPTPAKREKYLNALEEARNGKPDKFRNFISSIVKFAIVSETFRRCGKIEL